MPLSALMHLWDKHLMHHIDTGLGQGVECNSSLNCCLSSACSSFLCSWIFWTLLLCRPQTPWIILTWTPGCCGSVSVCVSIWTPWLNSGREKTCHYVSSQQIPKLLQYLMAVVLECSARSCTNSTQKNCICLKRTYTPSVRLRRRL